MTDKLKDDLITFLQFATSGEILEEMRALIKAKEDAEAKLAEANDDLQFVERWANHHGQKPHMTPQETLSCIQHYPAIKAITKSYSDGKVPETRNPYAEIAALQARVNAMESQKPVGDGYTLIVTSGNTPSTLETKRVTVSGVPVYLAPGAAPAQQEVAQLSALHKGAMGVNRRLANDAERYQFLRDNYAPAILGAVFFFHATDSGEDDLDKVIDDRIDAMDEAALLAPGAAPKGEQA